MVSSSISIRKSHKSEYREWYEQRHQLGISPATAHGYVYAWHEDGEPGECKIGYCAKDPFEYLWEGSALSHQKRLPKIFLSIGTTTIVAAKKLEHRIHSRLDASHMERSCAREWFAAHRDSVCACAREVVSEMEREGAI